MGLTELLDQPELAVTIGGREYFFSELPLLQRAKLQSFIQTKLQHPLEAVKPHLQGLDPEDRAHLLNEARKEGNDWPPDVETARGKVILLSSDSGQIETLFQGLSIHHPNLTRDDARKLFKQLGRETRFEAKRAKSEGREYDGEGAVQRIYACLFGLGLPSDDEGTPRLKAGHSQSNGLTGVLSFDDARENSGCASGTSDSTP
jgi:hypothetical protein